MTFEDQSIRSFLDEVAAKQPTPGGGAVASIVASFATALGQMVVNYSIGRKTQAEHDALHREALTTLRELGERSLSLAVEDARAYARLNALLKLTANDPQRVAELPNAVEHAINAPHAVLHTCMETLRLLHRLTGATNAMLASDMAMAAILAEAGARSAACNVRINLPLLEEELVRSTFEQTIARTLSDARRIAEQVQDAATAQATGG